ncbi:MAG TPA: hypothetical protein VIM31_00855 [Candidatus Microsaccharimonas sp.]|jgi:hypothetical protein
MSAHEEESMRSVMKMTGVALVVALGLTLTACASSTPEAYDASKVSCETVAKDISSAKTSLSNAQASLKGDKGTPAEASDKSDVAAAQAKLDALNKRSDVCSFNPNAKTAGKITYTDAELKAMADSLTVSTIPASAVCKTDANGLVAPAIDSLLAVPPRLWPDAISTKITATDPVAARVELQEAICKDPNLGVAWLTFVATQVRDKLLAATGIDLLVLNSRLKAYTDVSQITPKATAFVPLLNVKVADRTPELVTKAINQNQAWQQDAGLVNTLLERYAALGIDTRQSVVNYTLVDYGQNAGAIPVIGINSKPDDRPAQLYALTSKTQCGEIVTFGANVGDKRPELFEAKKCTPPPTTTSPGCKVNCTTTHNPTCKEKGNCPKPPTCLSVYGPTYTGTYPGCKGPSSEDPSQNGNANTGGGQNADKGPGTYVPPAEVVHPPAIPYVPPAAPSSGSSSAPVIAPSGPSAPASATDTSGQSGNGAVSGTGSGPTCNQLVMSC